MNTTFKNIYNILFINLVSRKLKYSKLNFF